MSRHILIVEDEPTLRDVFRRVLESSGYRISEAGTGAEARAAVLADMPDLVMLDLGLPDVSGLDIAREIRNDPATAHIPVIALTGRAGVGDRQACLDAGCQAYFAKPPSTKELLRRLPRLMSGQGL